MADQNAITLNLDKSLHTFLMVFYIFDDESENLTLNFEIKKCRNPNDRLKIKFKYKVK